MDNLQYVGSGNSGYWELNEGDDNIILEFHIE